MQEKVAVKFFLDERAYTMESSLYSLPQIQRAALTDTTFNANIDNTVRAYNYVFPAHTVTPMGKSLESMMSQGSIEKLTIVQV